MSTPPSQKKQAAAPTSPHLAMISIGCTRVMNKQKKTNIAATRGLWKLPHPASPVLRNPGFLRGWNARCGGW